MIDVTRRKAPVALMGRNPTELFRVFCSATVESVARSGAVRLHPGDVISTVAKGGLDLVIDRPRENAPLEPILNVNPFEAYFDALEFVLNIGTEPINAVCDTLRAGREDPELWDEAGGYSAYFYADQHANVVNLRVVASWARSAEQLFKSTILNYAMLLEVVAGSLGAQVGWLTFTAPGFTLPPVGDDFTERVRKMAAHVHRNGQQRLPFIAPYRCSNVHPDSELLGTDIPVSKLLRQIRYLAYRQGEGLTNALLVRFGLNMYWANYYWLHRAYDDAIKYARYVSARDWRAACVAWIKANDETLQTTPREVC